jgi:hypothetical protein
LPKGLASAGTPPPDELPLAPLDEAPLDAPLDDAPELAPLEESAPASPDEAPELVLPEDAPEEAPLDPLPLEVVASPPLEDVPEDEPFEPEELLPEAFDPSVVPSVEPPSSSPACVPLLPPHAAAATNAASAATRTKVDLLNPLIIVALFGSPRRRIDEAPNAYQLWHSRPSFDNWLFRFPTGNRTYRWSRVVARRHAGSRQLTPARSCSTCRDAFVRVVDRFV